MVGSTSKRRSRRHSPPLASRVVVPPMVRPLIAASKAWKSCTVDRTRPQWQSGGLFFSTTGAPPAREERRPAHRVANSLPGANLKRHLPPHTLPDCGLEAAHTRAWCHLCGRRFSMHTLALGCQRVTGGAALVHCAPWSRRQRCHTRLDIRSAAQQCLPPPLRGAPHLLQAGRQRLGKCQRRCQH